MKTLIKELAELIVDQSPVPADWGLKAVVNDDNLSFLVWHRQTKEALIVDAMREDSEAWTSLRRQHADLRILAVIDTHTHADHVSLGWKLAELFEAPYLMHQLSPTSRAHLRVSRDGHLPTAAGPIRFLTTPGHTPDSLAVLWGPFLFAGDTIMHGDAGRDDLPGGDPVAHCGSLKKIKSAVPAAAAGRTFMLPNHDGPGGRVTSWKTQLEINPSLTQNADDFIREATAYVADAPKNLKESLFENFK